MTPTETMLTKTLPKLEADYEKCDVCSGQGRVAISTSGLWHSCPLCRGRGNVRTEMPKPEILAALKASAELVVANNKLKISSTRMFDATAVNEKNDVLQAAIAALNKKVEGL